MPNFLVTSERAVEELCNRIERSKKYGADTESHGPQLDIPRRKKKERGEMLNMYRSTTTGASFCFEDDHAYYVPLAHNAGNCPPRLVSAIGRAMSSAEGWAWLHGAKHDLFAIDRAADLRRPGHVRCTLVGAWTTSIKSGNPKKPFPLKLIAKRHLGMDMATFEETTKGRQFNELLPKEAVEYPCDDARAAFRLSNLIEARLDKYNLWPTFNNQEMPMVDVAFEMEHAGFPLNREALADLAFDLASEDKRLENELLAMLPVNPRSPDQVGKMMYDVLGEWSVDLLKLTETGGKPLTKDALDLHTKRCKPGSLGRRYAETLLKYRAIHKNVSTYTFNFLRIADNYQDGYLHPNVLLHGTDTGRISMADPNLMNIPVRTELGRKIRECFMAPEGDLLVSADYSQIELRLLAHITQDPTLIKAFQDGVDIHQFTADLLGISRDAAKIVNFAYIYGAGKFRLAKQIGCTPDDAAGFMKRYRRKYEAVPAWREEFLDKVRKTGYVRTLGGNVHFFPDINLRGNDDETKKRRSAAERKAGNVPFQGGAANLVKRAMINVRRAVAEASLPIKIRNQVHDDIILTAPEALAQNAGALLTSTMERVAKLRVPLKADLKISKEWKK